MDSITSFGKGFLSQGWDTVKGVGQMIAHPVDTAEGLYHAATHPTETWQGIKASVSDAVSKNHAEASGRAVFEVAALFTPAALTKVSTAARAARALRAAEVASEAGHVAQGARLAETASQGARIAEAATQGTRGAAEATDAARAARTATHAGEASSLGRTTLDGLARLPRDGETKFGHWASKHGPKSAEDAAAAQQKLKAGQSTTWFKSNEAMSETLKAAPEQLRGVLAADPKKLQEFSQFMSTPKEGAAFGFRFKMPGSVGEGVAADGAKLANDGTVYVRYQWAKGAGGEVSPQVFTAYPVGHP